MDLVPYMYWERQEAGSQLCAQHCLNNLLQQHTYSEFDLAEIAQRLDQAENAALSSPNQNKKSYNYDDTGFFSISVLERAMQVWDLSLVRWRGEAMKPYQEHPEEQAAFILNLSSHWIPLRRFSPTPLTPASKKRWYNLNSFLPNGPEWISPTYLRMVLSQAEQEGYSVFVVRKANHGGGGEGLNTREGEGWGDGGIGQMPECEADRIAVALGEPMGRGGGVNSPNAGGSRGVTSSRAALASMNPDQPSVDLASIPPVAGPSSPPAARRRRQPDLFDPSASDEFTTSQPSRPARELSRQQSAGVDLLDDQFGTFPEDLTSAARDENDEDEEFHDVQEQGLDDGMAEYRHAQELYGGPTDFVHQSRSYDDEDAALQAALKASMDDLPPGWVAPPVVPKGPIQRAAERVKDTRKVTQQDQGAALSSPTPAPAPASTPQWKVREEPQTSVTKASGSKFKEEIEEDEDDAPAEKASADEIRRRRLAKFGGS